IWRFEGRRAGAARVSKLKIQPSNSMVRLQSVLKLDRPVCLVEKLFPGFIFDARELLGQHRAALGLLRPPDQTHPRLVRRPPPLAPVAAQAGADDVLPVRQPPAAAGNDVIEAELLRRKPVPAELAAVFVAQKDIPPVELDDVFGKKVVAQQP